jgi:hypothetical protein
MALLSPAERLYARMQRLRSIPGFVRVLVALFALAQFAGVVSSPRTGAHPADMLRSAVHRGAHAGLDVHAHMHDTQPSGPVAPADHQHDGHASLADACCALHAYFVGMLPFVMTVAATAARNSRLVAAPDPQDPGTPADRLDRPPRPSR